MYIYISIEDLVANALIELIEKSQKNEVFFSDLNRYGACVLKILNSKEEQAVLILSQEKTTEFLHDYSNYFELFSKDEKEGIRLKANVTVDELWKTFRGYLSTNVLLAFMSDQSFAALSAEA